MLKLKKFKIFKHRQIRSFGHAIFGRALKSQDKIAVVSGLEKKTYRDLLIDSFHLRTKLPSRLSPGSSISILTRQDYGFVKSLFATWLHKGVAVPLAISHPPSEFKYYLNDSQTRCILTDSEFLPKIKPVAQELGIPVIGVDEPIHSPQPIQFNQFSESYDLTQPAQIIYTSGTTGKPKGCIHTHNNLLAMMDNMIQFWKWSSSDSILGVLPLHHVHGLVNVVQTSLLCGAKLTLLPKFDAEQIWELFLDNRNDLTLFMGVPTLYHLLLQKLESMNVGNVQSFLLKKFRLMVSGSMSLPDPLFNRWESFTGHRLLERYGMSEIGMALSNTLNDRRPGFVGLPMPSVLAQISPTGELLIKGPSVFSGYLGKPEATQAAFDSEGWFLTGDIATQENGFFRILGRSSVDIIKSKGFKISALDIERTILADTSVSESVVFGIPHELLGEQIVCLIVPRKTFDLKTLQERLKTELAPYKIPHVFQTVSEIPKNAMGKINKKDLMKQYSLK